jgi:putative ABC transport system permease protein
MYIHVKVADGQEPTKVAARIIEQTGMAALTNAEYSRASTEQLLEHTGILINFGITVALGFLIGMLVAGQTFYSFVLENLRHFGALKAMGASNFTVLRMIVLQVLVVGGVGYGIGLGTSSLIGVLFGGGRLAFSMTWHIPVAGLIGVLACCCLAGLLGAVQVLRLEPAVVFKS